MKSKHAFHIVVFRMVTSDAVFMLLFNFPHGFRLNTGAYIKCLKKVLLPGSRWWLLEDPMSGNRTPHCDTHAEVFSVGSKISSATTTFQTFCHLIFQIAILLIIMFGARVNLRPTKLRARPKMNWRQR